MDHALYDTAFSREWVGLNIGEDTLPDETTILRFIETLGFRHLLEKHNLAQQMLDVDNAVLSKRGLKRRQGTVVDTATNAHCEAGASVSSRAGDGCVCGSGRPRCGQARTGPQH